MQNNQTISKSERGEAQLRDRCLSWGFPGVVILIISLLAALRIGSSFQQSSFVTCISFVVCAMLLGLVYYVIFLSLPICIYSILVGKHEAEKDSVEQTTEPPCEEDSVQDTIPFPTFNQEYYDSRRQPFLIRQEEERQARLSSIIDYTRRVMPPLMKMEEIEHLCNEVRKWADDVSYRPEAVHMLPDAIKLDAKHYVWNIAERLRGEHAKVDNRSPFIQSLFHDMFRDNEITSLKNLTVKPNEGTIKIDIPEKGSYLFAYQKPDEEG